MMRSCEVLAGAAMLAALCATGCGDACDDLEARCDGCQDSGLALSCAIVVGEDDADACQMLLDDGSFQQSCP